MLAIIKIAGLSAALSAGVMTAMDTSAPTAAPAGSTKLYTERAPASEERFAPIVLAAAANAEPTATVPGRGDREGATGCAGQTWPYIKAECLGATSGNAERRPVRTITVEQTDGRNGSVLVRVPAASTASR